MSAPASSPLTPDALRAKLAEIILKDLLGPAGGPNEEVAETRVRDRYLVGLLAPKQQQVTLDEQDDLAVGGEGSSDDGAAEPTAPPAPTLFPSSFGLSFCVDLSAEAFQIAAAWGEYQREPSQVLKDKTGDSKTVWRRYPRGGFSKPIGLSAGKLADWSPDPESPEVTVQGLIRKRDDHWSVTLFLVNTQAELRPKDRYWVFQPELGVYAPDRSSIFARRLRPRDGSKANADLAAEEQALEMMYRHRNEFAVGHGVSVRVDVDPERDDRAKLIHTAVAPQFEVAQATPPTERDFPALAGLIVDMKELAETPRTEFRKKIEPLVGAYSAWIDDRAKEAESAELAPFRQAALRAVGQCRAALKRLSEGLALIESDDQAARAFQFANRAMWLQRVRTMYAEERRRGKTPVLADLDVPVNRSWRAFQLAFVLINLPALVRLDHPDRSTDAGALCDLLWFPTGGGKTEAYLGLAAFAMGIRRLQGVVAGRKGEDGLAVLMRYTLRLLTLQQFQRAAALICACELIRKDAVKNDGAKWGTTPFRLGLWVGQKTTPNTTDQAHEAVVSSRGNKKGFGFRGVTGSPYQLTCCPWCGSKLDEGRDIKVKKAPNDVGRTLMYCSDLSGRCAFTSAKSNDEGIPVLVVDEEIYRLLPAMLIATVDKFAQMPWNGRVGMLFGMVDKYCERHGYRSPDVDDADSHPAAGSLPAVRSVPANPLRPPDLIIQDELHLISGPLGSLVGLYETAVDRLCSWEVDGKLVRPKVIASTATVRNAGDQVHGIFARQVSVFPPSGLDVRDNFFSLERKPSQDVPGRLYLGICAPGRRLKAAMIRTYLAAMAGAQQLYNDHAEKIDPWMTLVGYFNSMLELGGMRRLVEDDVKTRLGKADLRGLAQRQIQMGAVEELTSRKSSSDIPDVLDRMEIPFDPAYYAARARLKSEGKPMPPLPLDVLLATNMISVGVDVRRLGLMVVAGQPKTTAEYIQATSRVGRSKPGLVCTVYNWARPRDLSHYERFEHYHGTFYKHVEPLSVTPFSAGALARGLTALLVSGVRQSGIEFNENRRAGAVKPSHACVAQVVNAIVSRAHEVRSPACADLVKGELKQRVDEWDKISSKITGGAVLGYKDARDRTTIGLLKKPSTDPWDHFTCLNSLRDVEPVVNLILDDGKLDDEPGGVQLEIVDDDGEEA